MKKPAETQKVVVESGSVIRKQPDTQVPLWKIDWKTAQLEYTDEQKFGGTMETVSGVFYDSGQPASDFKADRGFADKLTQTLQLTGGVTVVSTNPKATIRCDAVEFDASKGYIECKGNVWAETPNSTIGPVDTVWASRNLKIVATPDLYNAK